MKKALRGPMLSFAADPFLTPQEECLRYEPDALIVMEGGKIVEVGPASLLLPQLSHLPELEIEFHADSLILPGFIDCHVHYAQTEIIGAYGEQLLEWLERYAFVAEQGFADPTHAKEVAGVFLQEQLRNGVTTSSVYCTVFPQSVEALFQEAEKLNLRILAGKVCMDRHCPEGLRDSAKQAYDDSKALLRRWHGKGRAEYVLTPRFAPTSSVAQLEALGALAAEYPDLPVQTHVSENLQEIAWVGELFPEQRNYTEVYDRFGLLRKRVILGHGVHLEEDEFALLSERGAGIAHCPSSNFFIGSGCFHVERSKLPSRPVKVGLGTDVGGGTSFSMLRTLGEAYKMAQMNGISLPAPRAFYLATRGGAELLGLEDKVGSIAAGMEADITVLNLKSTPLLEYRMRYARNLEEVLFLQMILGDDRAVAATYVAGEKVYSA